MLSLPHYDYQLDKSTDRLALAFWTRSAAQDNGDALVKMGDYYMHGMGVASSVPQPEKAAACYASAANTHYSSIAMYNLGWMHENGFGVSQVRQGDKGHYCEGDSADDASFLYRRTSIWLSGIMTLLSRAMPRPTCLSRSLWPNYIYDLCTKRSNQVTSNLYRYSYQASKIMRTKLQKDRNSQPSHIDGCGAGVESETSSSVDG